MSSTDDRIPKRPVVVRLIAGVVAILAILSGVLLNLAAYYLSRWWGTNPPLSQDLADFALITSIATGCLIVAVQLWRGSGWARLATQLGLAFLGIEISSSGLAQLSIGNLWGLAALGIASVAIGAAVYLETSSARGSFHLQRAGIIARHPVASIAILMAIGLLFLLLGTSSEISRLPVNRYR
jgi:hypothetical protein